MRVELEDGFCNYPTTGPDRSGKFFSSRMPGLIIFYGPIYMLGRPSSYMLFGTLDFGWNKCLSTGVLYCSISQKKCQQDIDNEITDYLMFL